MVITGTIGNRVVFTGSGVRIPSLPPKKEKYEHSLFVFLFFLFIRGFERLGSRRVNGTIIISPQRADQTADETAVCETGVIANIVCGANPLASAKKREIRTLVVCISLFYLLGDSNGSADQPIISFRAGKNQKTTKNYSRAFPFFYKTRGYKSIIDL